MRRLDGDYDYIIVGAGTAGCILANRLSADPGRRVLLLEAGGRDNWIWLHIPVGYMFAIGHPRSDWMFRTESEPGLERTLDCLSAGKVIGGSSAINAMICMRGQAADYDGWRSLGLAWLGLERRAAGVQAIGRALSRRRASITASVADGEWKRRASLGGCSMPCATPRSSSAYRAIDDFNCGDNEGGFLFPRQPEARPALVCCVRDSEAGAGAQQPAARDPCARRAPDHRERPPACGRAIPATTANWSRRVLRARGDSLRRRHRLAAHPQPVRHRAARVARSARHRDAAAIGLASARTCRITCSSARSTRSATSRP
jgi:choline dehydrogenase-like flavoprotein